MKRIALGAAMAAIILTQSSCGGGSTGELEDDVAVTTAEWLLLDLANGTVTPTAAVADLDTNATYRDRVMVFRRIEGGSSAQGQAAGSFAAQADETRSDASMPHSYVGIFEVTQAQWVRLAGTRPWQDLPTGLVVAGLDDDRAPAYNLGRNEVRTRLSSAAARLGVGLVLPSDAQWERAARGGTAGIFAWGDSRDTTVADTQALVSETGAGRSGPDQVGQRQANAVGLFDVHGNVWEVTAEGSLRGGSWHDSLTMARCANKVDLDPDATHALVGARLMLEP